MVASHHTFSHRGPSYLLRPWYCWIMPNGESALATILFSIFALLTTTGAFLIADRFKSRGFAIMAAVLTAALFALLMVGVRLLLVLFDG